MGDALSDCSPLVRAAGSGRLRLVRLLLEGGAQVNGRDPRGETALLAACKALREEPAPPETIRLLTHLLRNKADPNAQDGAGRTALMYACMVRAGVQVASALLSAGADPRMEDHSGASALVYAVNTQHQPTLKVLMDACRAKGCDIIIIATEVEVGGGPVTRRYLNVPPSPDTWPLSCMSPSDIVLKTGSTKPADGENIFNFRGTSRRGGSSSSITEDFMMREGDEEDEVEKLNLHPSVMETRRGREKFSRFSRSLLSLPQACSPQAPRVSRTSREPASREMPPRISDDQLPACPPHRPQPRRNTLPSVLGVPPPLHLPPLGCRPESGLQDHQQVPSATSRFSPGSTLPPLPPLPPTPTAVTPARRRCHSVQLEHRRGGAEQVSFLNL